MLNFEARASSLKMFSTNCCLFSSSEVRLIRSDRDCFALTRVSVLCESTPHLSRPCLYVARKSVATACCCSMTILYPTSSFMTHLYTREVANSMMPESGQKKEVLIWFACMYCLFLTTWTMTILCASQTAISPSMAMEIM